MGVFQHEAACVDPLGQHVFLSEDVNGGGLYRYTPEAYPDLTAGVLAIACDGGGGRVAWKPLADPGFTGPTPLRAQHADSLKFARGEGIWYDAGLVYLATTTDQTIHVYDTNASTVSILYKADEAPGTPLRGVDNVHVSRSGDLFVAEDSYDGDPDAMDVCIITPEHVVARFLKLTGEGHFLPGSAQSETVGITFDPSGTRMYVGSQRFQGTGIVYEISGPFRRQRPATPSTTPPLGPGIGAPGLPIGIEVARRIPIAALIRNGLALGLTLDKAATVRVRLTARLKPKGRPARRMTLAAATRRPGQGHATLRIKPSKTQARLLRGRRQGLTATIEVRLTTPGAPERVLRSTVRLTS
jgi:secreted PhoX family phosphatase